MTPSEIIARKQTDWLDLEKDLDWMRRTPARRRDPERLAAFARRYRSACSDLAEALALRFPPNTTRYLHQLVATAHTALYQGESFKLGRWLGSLFTEVPRRVATDPATWIAFTLFWALFLGSSAAAILQPGFASKVVGDGTLASLEAMYSQPIGTDSDPGERPMMTGFYVFNNAGIGLQCFASGIFLGVGSLVILSFNAILLGTIFGYMLTSPQRDHFGTFVTAHGPFELTAVVLSAAAGLRLGWSLLDTGGFSRGESLRRSAPKALETAGLATLLFLLAAYIEGFISPAPFPYRYKAGVAVACTLLLVGYFSGFTFRKRGAKPR